MLSVLKQDLKLLNGNGLVPIPEGFYWEGILSDWITFRDAISPVKSLHIHSVMSLYTWFLYNYIVNLLSE